MQGRLRGLTIKLSWDVSDDTGIKRAGPWLATRVQSRQRAKHNAAIAEAANEETRSKDAGCAMKDTGLYDERKGRCVPK
jgi:hypothetical protein